MLLLLQKCITIIILRYVEFDVGDVQQQQSFQSFTLIGQTGSIDILKGQSWMGYRCY